MKRRSGWWAKEPRGSGRSISGASTGWSCRTRRGTNSVCSELGRGLGDVVRLRRDRAVTVDPLVDTLPPREQPVDQGLALRRDLVGGHTPVPGEDGPVERDPAPQVPERAHVFQDGVG